MAGYQAFALDEVEKGLDGGGSTYREFLRRPGVSVGLYRLPAGGSDAQHPHDTDEVYVVRSGRARLVVEGATIDVGPGTVVSVDRQREHRFVDIEEDLVVLVVFAPPDTPDA
jgi:mannose-6-phosphate isomerase-like protein (cupin superfamily)